MKEYCPCIYKVQATSFGQGRLHKAGRRWDLGACLQAEFKSQLPSLVSLLGSLLPPLFTSSFLIFSILHAYTSSYSSNFS